MWTFINMYPKCNQNSQKLSKTLTPFYCSFCDYSASRRSDFKKHLGTAKHSKNCNQNVTKNSQKLSKTQFFCHFCNKSYKSRMGIWRHNKKNHSEKIKNGMDSHRDISGIVDWESRAKIAENKIVDLQTKTIKILEEKLNNTQTINNIQTQNNTQHISINVFLNEYCKDAMSLKDFISKLNVTLQDLENTKHLGYSDGVSNLLMNGLKEIPDIDKPIWSTDKKRNKFVVKGDDGWEKDDGAQVDEVLQMVKYKHLKALTKWECEHPNFQNNPHELEEWQRILEQMSDGTDLKEKEKNKKIIHKNLHEIVNIKNAINEMKD